MLKVVFTEMCCGFFLFFKSQPPLTYVVNTLLTNPHVPYVVKTLQTNPFVTSCALCGYTLKQLPTSHNPVYAPTYTDPLPISHIPDRNRNNRSLLFESYKYS